jgi:hypothetical protein
MTINGKRVLVEGDSLNDPSAAPPGAPTSLSVSSTAVFDAGKYTTDITASWTAPQNLTNWVGYELLWQESGASTWITEVTSNTSVIIRGLKLNTVYVFKVRSAGTGLFSAFTTNTTHTSTNHTHTPASPATPTITCSFRTVVINWSAHGDSDITTYELSVSYANNYTWSVAFSGLATSFVFNTTNTPGQWYARVRVKDANGNWSGYSSNGFAVSSYIADTDVVNLPSGYNMLINSDFEGGFDGWTMVAGAFQIDTNIANPATGGKAARNGAVGNELWIRNTKMLPVSPLKTYVMEAYFRATTVGTTGKAGIGLMRYSASQGSLDADSQHQTFTELASTDFVRHTILFGYGTANPLPATCAYVKVDVRGNWLTGTHGDRVHQVQGIRLREVIESLYIQDLAVTTAKIANLAVTDAKISSLAADKILLSDDVFGNIRLGKGNYADTTAGFWLGQNAGVPKFHLGDPTSFMKWTGTALEVAGKITMLANSTGFTNFADKPLYYNQITQPASPKELDRWYNPNTSLEKQYTSRAWVTVSSLGAPSGTNVGTTTADQLITDLGTALTNASNASAAASNADQAAAAAQITANAAQSSLNDLANDNRLTAVEKQIAKGEWDTIVAEKANLLAQAAAYSVSSTTYSSVYDALNSYLYGSNGYLTDLATTSIIVGTTWRSTWAAYYTAKQDMLNAIYAKAKLLADTAQGLADTLATQTANYRNTSPASNDGAFGTIPTGTATPDGNVVVSVPYTYTQGLVVADQLFVFVKEGGGSISAADPAFATNAASGSLNFVLKPSTVYTFGIQAVRRTEAGLVGTAILTSSQITTVAGNYTGNVSGTSASTLVSNAATALSQANAANAALADIASDSKFTPSEKSAVKLEYTNAINEVAPISNQGTTLGITTEVTAYVSAYNLLNAYIFPLVSDLTTTSDIVGDTFRTKWSNYYTTRQTLLNKIAEVAATKANWSTVTGVPARISMDTLPAGTPAGLYLTNGYMGFYDGSAWATYIASNGQFYFKGNATNYLQWNGSALTVRGALVADDIKTGTLNASLLTVSGLIVGTNVTMGANATITWANVNGTGRPADNATVGATAGTNLWSSTGASLGDAAIITAQGTANNTTNVGSTTAAALVSQAATAASQASTAKAYVDNLASDAVVTPDEKVALKPQWDVIVAEASLMTGKYVVQADSLGVSSTALTNAFTVLNTYLNTTLTLFSNMTTATSGVVRVTWNAYWTNYLNARVDLLNALAAKAALLAVWSSVTGIGKPADNATVGAQAGVNLLAFGGTVLNDAAIITAQGTANNTTNVGSTTAVALVNQAAAAASQAAAAKAYTDNLASDSVVTPDEKVSLKPGYDAIIAEGNGTNGTLVAQANSLSVTHSAYDTAYSTLVTYIGTTLNLFSNMGVATTGIVRSTWNTNWVNYFNARTVLMNALAAKAATTADWSTVSGRPNTTYIDANGIYTGNLSAINITGCSISGTTISGGTITGATLETGAGNIGVVRLSGQTLVVRDETGVIRVKLGLL